MIFIIFHKDGTRTSYSNEYDEDNEQERDAAWEDVCNKFPDVDYIEAF